MNFSSSMALAQMATGTIWIGGEYRMDDDECDAYNQICSGGGPYFNEESELLAAVFNAVVKDPLPTWMIIDGMHLHGEQ